METTQIDTTTHGGDRRSDEARNGHQPAQTEQTAQTAQTAQAGQESQRPPSKPSRLIILVRHGQTTYNVEQRLPGQVPGVALTEEGRRQAYQAAVALSAVPISAVISSPLERARDTAEILARGWGMPVQQDPRLMDTDVPRWAGRKISEVSKDDPTWKAYLDNPLDPPEGVESFASVQQRAVAVVEEVLRDPARGNYIALVAHADVVKLIIAHYTGIPITGARFLTVGNASLSALAFSEHDPAHLLAMNWTPTPGWLVPPLPGVQQEPQTAGGISEPAASTDGGATEAAEAPRPTEQAPA